MPEFFRYVHDRLYESTHIHVERGTEEPEFGLEPASIEYISGIPRHELRRIREQ